MDLLRQTYYIEHIELILFFGLVGFVLNRIAFQKSFYKLPVNIPFTQIKLSLIHVVICFVIYLINSVLLAPWVLSKIHPFFISYQEAAAWAQVSVMFCSFLILWGFCKSTLQKSFKQIWKVSLSGSSFSHDILIGIASWILAFPIVAVVEQTADLIVYSLFGLQTYEQVAVLYLKMALKSPSELIAALLMILVSAPLIEEFLFRGLLQTWIKKHLGMKAAILLASLCFALFHVSPSYGVGNFSLVPSLFIFSCFLGFIYERQKSLFASIILHATFNLVSTLRIIFTIDSL